MAVSSTAPSERATRAPDPDAMISVRGLWKIFGPRADRIIGSPAAALSRAELHAATGCTMAVRDVGFDVRPGEVFVVMGLSGSGKSTLVRCLARLVERTAGTISLDGENICGASDRRLREIRRHKISMVFQHFGLLPHRRVIDNVAYGLEIQGVGRDQRHRRAREILDLVGLAGSEASYPDQLSGGMQQRVGLGRALAVDPDVLLFDEPFSALDPLIRRDMQNEVIRLHREVGKTMLFITHDLTEALKLGDRIAIMRDGEIVQTGTPEDLVGAPADGYVTDFVRDIPKADVLTLRWIARPPRPGEPLPDGPELPGDLLVRDAVRTVIGAAGPARVVAGGELLGMVDSEAILAIITSHEPPTATTGGPGTSTHDTTTAQAAAQEITEPGTASQEAASQESAKPEATGSEAAKPEAAAQGPAEPEAASQGSAEPEAASQGSAEPEAAK